MAASIGVTGSDEAERPGGVRCATFARPAFTARMATGLSPRSGCVGGLITATGWAGGGCGASSRQASTYAAAARRLRASLMDPTRRSTPPAVARGTRRPSLTTVVARWPRSPATTLNGFRRCGVRAAGIAPGVCGACGGCGLYWGCRGFCPCGENAAAAPRAVVVMANARILI